MAYRRNNRQTFYVKMYKDGRTFVLWKMVYNKTTQEMVPKWWPESALGDTTPYLYKTLAKARNMIDRFECEGITLLAQVWSNDDAQIGD